MVIHLHSKQVKKIKGKQMKILISVLVLIVTLMVCAHFKIENNYVFFGVELALLFCFILIFYRFLGEINLNKIKR